MYRFRYLPSMIGLSTEILKLPIVIITFSTFRIFTFKILIC